MQYGNLSLNNSWENEQKKRKWKSFILKKNLLPFISLNNAVYRQYSLFLCIIFFILTVIHTKMLSSPKPIIVTKSLSHFLDTTCICLVLTAIVLFYLVKAKYITTAMTFTLTVIQDAIKTKSLLNSTWIIFQLLKTALQQKSCYSN